uniref:Gypsy retrotransposon integrase-like protein 1 n=1 Tax=Cyprinus carpio TaxID=7962 RepID=A0A8C1RHP2_CYPCA
MDTLDKFFAAPSDQVLDTLTKEQLCDVSEHYNFELGLRKNAKLSQIRQVVRTKLAERKVLPSIASMDELEPEGASTPRASLGESRSNFGLTFEQQKELLEMQQREREAERQLEYNKIKSDREIALERFRLIAEGKIISDTGGDVPIGPARTPDISNMARLLPRFNEKDPDVFFSLFESVADDRGWSDSERTLLLQSVLVGKAQEAFIALSVPERKIYKSVKDAVLKVYELVPEAYRLRFRNWKKGEKQTYTELVRELNCHFNRWCVAVGVSTFEELCNLIVLEQFRNILPDRIAIYINERKVKTAADAAVLSDEYVLTHRQNFKEYNPGRGYREQRIGRFSERSVFSNTATSQSGAREQFRGKADPDACRYCLEKGHWKNECPALKEKGQRSKPGASRPVALAVSGVRARSEFIRTEIRSNPEVGVASSNLSADSLVGSNQYSHSEVIEADVNDYSPFITDGFVSLVGSSVKVPVKILRDTGACESFLLESVLPLSSESSTGNVLVRGIGLQVVTVPLHRIELQSDLVQGEVVIAVRHSLPVDGVHLLLGNNLAGERVWRDVPPPVVVKSVPSIPSGADSSLQSLPEVFPACAVTRAMNRASGTEVLEKNRKPDLQPIVLPDLPSSLSFSDFVVAQKEDSTLSELFAGVLPVEERHSAARGYFVQDGLLVRKWMPQINDVLEDPVFQIVVPVKFRDLILQTAHGDIAGHLGVRKTYDRLMKYFYWPCLKKDVACFIKTCHTCQLTGKPNQVIKPAPLYPIPALGKPFEYLLIDCVGPLPPSKSGCVYLLTVMCQATRYPAAYALRTISTKSVVKALSQFISIFGIPQIIQSDRGSNFTSRMFSEVLEQLHVKHQLSSAYHAQSQGSLERFHQTLKSLLRGYCVQLSKDWEEGLPWLLLAAREVTQESTGFSPNDLVFGHRVRGPLAVLQDKLKCPESPTNLLEYVNGFRRKLFLACEMAVENLTKAQKKMKSWYDRRAEPRIFSLGDQVLALLPIAGSPFLAKYAGPYTVVRQVSDLNYLVSTPDRRRTTQLCHINLLKPYYSRSPVSGAAETGDQVKSVALAAVAGISSFSSHMVAAGGDEDVVSPDDCVLQPRLKNSEKLSELDTLLGHLSKERALEVESLIFNFPALFSDTPSCTHLIQHDIDVGDTEPIRQRFYRVSFEKQQHLETEVKYLLNNGLAEPSYSSWASPCILVSKPDGTYRFCTDYRKLNNITKPDSFPLPRVEDCVDRVGSARFVSKFDLLKGYYQVPLTPRAQEVSAFITPSGLYSYSVMSFGLRNAPATFQRLMNRVVSGLQGCAVYLDDVVVYSDGWSEHLERIQALFTRLVEARLTVNLAKCEFAQATVVYLGKVVGQGQVRPVHAKVVAIDNFPVPATKPELRRFLGMVGYYRGFCANFSTVVAPLTDLLKGRIKFDWTAICQAAFENVKLLLTSAPVLMAPRMDQSFQMQVDASHVGAGAVLLQRDEQGVVCFFSKKFNHHQLNYSTIEKETLALIWGLQHFHVYLSGGAVPVTIYSDHNPLTFLYSLKSPSQRLMRWVLFLQPYSLLIRHIRGVDNIMADALSRAPCEPE